VACRQTMVVEVVMAWVAEIWFVIIQNLFLKILTFKLMSVSVSVIKPALIQEHFLLILIVLVTSTKLTVNTFVVEVQK